MQTDAEVIAGWVRTRYPDYRSPPDRVAAGRRRWALLGAAHVVALVAVH